MNFLKQSTQTTVMFGPFVDKADGVTLKTDATTITDIDHATTGIFLSKNGATGAIRHQGIAAASVADAYGMMQVTLDTTDTGTLGNLRMMFAKAATYLPVHRDFSVIPADLWDTLFAAQPTAAIKKFFNVAAPTATCLSLPDAVPGSANGLPIIDATGTKLTKTVDLTAGQSIACSDKTGFSLSATGADLILSTSTFATAMATAIWKAATAGLTVAGSIGKKLADWTILTSAAIATAIWGDTTAGDFTGAGSIGKSLYTGDHAPGAASGLSLVGSVMGKSPATLDPGDCGGNLPAQVKGTDNIDFSATQKTSLNAATPAASNMRGTDSAALASTLAAALGTDGKALLSTDAQDRSTTLKVYVPDTQKVDVNTIKTKSVTVDAGGTTFPAVVGDSTLTVGDLGTVQSGDGFAILDDATVGNANLFAGIGAAIGAVTSLNNLSAADIATALTTYTAAKSGDKMDLVDAPNATAIAAFKTAILLTAMAESYAAAGATQTPAQALQMILAELRNFDISGTTRQMKKLNGTNAFSDTLDDDTAPTSSTPAT